MKDQSGNDGITSALYIWNGLTAFWGTSFHTDPHCHDSLQLVFDIDQSFQLKDQSSDWTSYSSAIIRTGHIHQLDSRDSIQLFLYLDPESEFAQKLSIKYLANQDICDLKNSDIGKISSSFFKKLLVISDCEQLFQGFLKIIEHLIDLEPAPAKDERITKAISFIRQARKPIKVKEVAEHVCLSESRFRFLFKREVGQPVQRFMLWMKVIQSVNPILKGNQITRTAYEAGFWDSAHLNRSYNQLLGIAPSAMKKYEKDLKIIACERSNFYTFKTEILADWRSDKPYRTVEL